MIGCYARLRIFRAGSAVLHPRRMYEYHFARFREEANFRRVPRRAPFRFVKDRFAGTDPFTGTFA
jgi:hypothetical protein